MARPKKKAERRSFKFSETFDPEGVARLSGDSLVGGVPLGRVGGRKPIPDIETSRLAGQLERQKGTAARLKQPEPGGIWGVLKDIKDVTVDPALRGTGNVLGGVMDVLQRGQYAVAEPVARIAEHLGPETPEERKGGFLQDVLGGLVGGAAGREKTGFADVLRRAAEADPGSLTSKAIRENRFGMTSALGLVGDIGFDPTTYLGLGLVGASADLNKAAKVAGDAARVAANSPEADKLAREAAQRVIRESKGKANPGKVSNAADAARRQYADTVGKQASEKYLKDNSGAVAIKVLGQPVKQSRAAYRYGRNAYKSALKIPGAQRTKDLVAKGFSLGAHLPGKTRKFFRIAENEGAEWARQDFRHIDDIFKGTNAEDRRLIAFAIDEGKQLDGRLGEIQKAVREMNDEFFQAERGMDLITPEQYREDYVLHHYRKMVDTDTAKQFKKNRRMQVLSGPHTSARKRQLQTTLREAEAAGLDPITDMRDILRLRALKSHRTRARGRWLQMIEGEYGTKLDGTWVPIKDKAGNVVSEKFVPSKQAKKILKDQGLERPKNIDFWPPDKAVPKEIAEAMGKWQELYTRDELADEFARLFDKVQGHWKFTATVLNPGHHIRNMVGDAWLNYLDGLVSPVPYAQAGKILKARNTGQMGEVIKGVKVGNTSLNGEELYKYFTHSGAKSGMISQELPSRSLGKVGDRIREVAETREDFMRFAHFIDAFKKEAGAIGAKDFISLDKAAQKAAERVRKWNIDYGDVTPFQRKTIRRLMPFSTFTTKNFPLQLEAIASRPGRVAAMPKGMRAIESLLGTDVDHMQWENITPDYIQEMSGFRLRGEGEGKNAIYVKPGFTIDEAMEWLSTRDQSLFEGLSRNVVSRLSPAITTPIEAATGRSLFTGGPRQGGLAGVLGLVPAARLAGSAFNVGGEPTSIKLLNYLTGLGIREVTPEQQRAQLRKEQDVVQRQIRQRRGE